MAVQGHLKKAMCVTRGEYLYEKDEKIFDISRGIRFIIKIYLKTYSLMMS